VTPSGIELATFRLVAQCLNRAPVLANSISKLTSSSLPLQDYIFRMVTGSVMNERLSAVSAYRIYVLKVRVKVKFTLEQATKPLKGKQV
jgi:hypothetical protein